MENKNKLYQYFAGGSLVVGLLILAFFFRPSDLSPSELKKGLPFLDKNEEAVYEVPSLTEENMNDQAIAPLETETDEVLTEIIQDLER